MWSRPTIHVRSGLLAVLLAASALASGCGTRSTTPADQASAPTAALAAAIQSRELRLAVDAQESASAALLARADVVGTGAALDASGRAQVVVLLATAGTGRLPSAVDGVPIVGWVVGSLQPWSLTGSYRPAPIGESIVQPSLPDLNPTCSPAPPSAVVATLSDFEPVVFDSKTPNIIDAAIAEVSLTPNQVSCATPAGYYGFPSGTVAAAMVGMHVMELGRTTELTRAQVKAVNAKIKITFPSGTALFVDQVLTTQGFGAFGDSGALMVTDDGSNRPVGIVIAGGSNGSAIVSPIGPILSRFSATVCSHFEERTRPVGARPSHPSCFQM